MGKYRLSITDKYPNILFKEIRETVLSYAADNNIECNIEQPYDDTLILKWHTARLEVYGIVARCIANHIISNHSILMLRRIANRNIIGLTCNDINSIVSMALDKVTSRKQVYEQYIINEIMEILYDCISINTQGIMNFRLQNYKHALENALDDALDKYIEEQIEKALLNQIDIPKLTMELDEKQSAEQIREVLKYKEGKYEEIHVKYEDGVYRIYNDKNEDITSDSYGDFADMIMQGYLNVEEALMCALIYLAPKKLVLHDVSKWEHLRVVNKIEKVFIGDRTLIKV